MRMTNSIFAFILTLLLFSAVEVGLSRQTMKRITFEGDAFLIPEAGCLVSMDSTSLSVLDVMPPGMRPKEYADLDVRLGDKILMVNGVKLKSVKDLRTLYEQAGVGSELKLGIARAGEKHLLAFKKADPAALPKRKMVTIDTGAVNVEKKK